MTGIFELGDNYKLEEDSSGNLQIVDTTTNTAVATHTAGGGWTLGANVDGDGNDLTNLGSVSTNEASTTPVTRSGESFDVADDDVISFTAPRDGILFVHADFGNASGLFHYREFNNLDSIVTGGNAENEGTGTTLSGTTGQDGNINVAKDGNTIFLENRTGGQRTLSYSLIGL